jgi:hypothetical protein
MTGRLFDKDALVDRLEALLHLDDTDLGASLLATSPTHESRPGELLREWAAVASRFGAELARDTEVSDTDGLAAATGLAVVHADGGITPSRLTLAQYVSRPPSIRIFDDAVGEAEELVELLGWRAWFPHGSVQDAAICHEVVHHMLRGPGGKVLKTRLDHVLFRVGPVTLRGHVLGADEVAAHSFARSVCGLRKSPLLISAALREASEFVDFAGRPLARSARRA